MTSVFASTDYLHHDQSRRVESQTLEIGTIPVIHGVQEDLRQCTSLLSTWP